MFFYMGRINPYARSKTWCAIVLMLTTAASALLASQRLTPWISIVSIVGSSVMSWVEFSGVNSKLSRYAGSISRLKDIRLWWHTLTPVQMAAVSNANQLVRLCESVIMADAKAWLATSQAGKTLGEAAAAKKR